MKQTKDCKVNGNLGRQIIKGKTMFAICPKHLVGGGCGAHGNKKCEHMVKAVDKVWMK